MTLLLLLRLSSYVPRPRPHLLSLHLHHRPLLLHLLFSSSAFRSTSSVSSASRPPCRLSEIKYITFKLSDDSKEIVVEKSSESSDYEDFINDLPPNSPRYAIYDFEYEVPGGGKRNKICFYAWCLTSSFPPFPLLWNLC